MRKQAVCRDTTHRNHARDDFFDGRAALDVILDRVKRPRKRRQKHDGTDDLVPDRRVVVEPG